MATTIPIPLATLQVGDHSFGPAPISDAFSVAVLQIDRTASRPGTAGFNGQPETTRAEIGIWQSDDGGATWQFRASAGIVGGEYTPPRGTQPYAFSDVTVELTPAPGRRVRADITVTGARVAVAGTLTIT